MWSLGGDALLVGGVLADQLRRNNFLNRMAELPDCALTPHILHKLLRCVNRLAEFSNVLACLST